VVNSKWLRGFNPPPATPLRGSTTQNKLIFFVYVFPNAIYSFNRTVVSGKAMFYTFFYQLCQLLILTATKNISIYLELNINPFFWSCSGVEGGGLTEQSNVILHLPLTVP